MVRLVVGISTLALGDRENGHKIWGLGKITAPLSGFCNILSTFRFLLSVTFPPQCDVSVVLAGWEVAESWRKAESTLTLAESAAVILP
jgi:hypothetical protein